MNAPFRITFPISKAEQREDGLYLIGEATGPEVDSEGERMAPEAIERFARQIEAQASMGDPLVYRDAHAKDGVLRDLGVITKAWITENLHLGIEVKLDEDNPAAVYLWKRANNGKKFGMSVAGSVLEFVDEFVAEVGKTVRTYLNVVLTEISNTTRPAWTPSFGTVLSKAIEDAEKSAPSDAEGENPLMSEELRDEQKTNEASVADETEKADDAAEGGEAVTESDSTEKAEEETTVEGDEETTEKADEDDAESEDEDVEKAGRKFSAAARNRLLGMYAEMGNALKELGLLEDDSTTETPEKSVSGDEGESTEKTDENSEESDLAKSELEALRTALAEATARIEELEKNRTVLPPVIERAGGETEDVRKKLGELAPMDRLRIGLASLHGESIS